MEVDWTWLSQVNPGQILILLVLVFATFLSWSYWRGRKGILRLYIISIVVLIALVSAAASQALQIASVIEPANLIAIAFSVAGCGTNPTLWREEIRADLEQTELLAPLAPGDLFSWKGLLKAVDRIGARLAALAYLALFVAGLVAAGATVQPTGPVPDRTPFLLALTPVALFALLSTWYFYRGARRLVPGA